MMDPHLAPHALQPFIQAALAEDVGGGDASTLAIVDDQQQARAAFRARTPCTVAGLPVVHQVFHELDPQVAVTDLVADGAAVAAGETIAWIEGPARAILTGERTALNLLQRMSGIATLTAKFVAALGDPKIAVLDTRKTIPTMRGLEKYAVRCGGGQNHRFGLYDRIMLKDNHLALAALSGDGAIGRAVARCRAAYPNLEIEIEADRLDQVEEALQAGADWILLDNMPRDVVDEAAKLRRKIHRATRLEASGGINLETIGRLRGADIDAISLGALTHSVPAIDIGLDFELDTPQAYPDAAR